MTILNLIYPAEIIQLNSFLKFHDFVQVTFEAKYII